MQSFKPVLLLVLSVLFLGLVTGYSGSGGVSTSTPPPEDSVYDMDISYIVSGGAPTENSPSAFYPSFVNVSDGSNLKDTRNSEERIEEAYVDLSSSGWGVGNPSKTNEFLYHSPGGDTRLVEKNSVEYAELRDGPELNEDSSTDDTCGNRVAETGLDEDNFNCPEDTGLADDFPPQYFYPGTDQRGSYSSLGGSTTVTESLGSMNGEPVKYIYHGGSLDSGNNIVYEEHGFDSGDDNEVDITEENSDSVNPWETSCRNNPDFFVSESNNDKLMSLLSSCPRNIVEDSESLGTFTDYNTPEDEDYTSYTDDKSMQVCTTGANCTGATSKCWGGRYTPENPPEEQQLNETEIDGGDVTSEAFYTLPDDPGYTTDSESNTWSLDVIVNREDGSTDVNQQLCDKTEKNTSCSSDLPDDIDGCDFTPETYYETEQIPYAADAEPHDVTINIDRVDTSNFNFVESKVFDTNPAEISMSRSDVKDGLFEGDDYRDRVVVNSEGGTGYYSVEPEDDGNDMENDDAVSVSTFTLDIDTGGEISGEPYHFVSRRTGREIYDADGSFGSSDGYVSIVHPKDGMSGDKSLSGWTDGFMAEETSSTGNSFVDTSDRQGFIESHSNIGKLPDCPGDLVTCVSVADLEMKSLDDWSDPTNPSTGVRINFPQSSWDREWSGSNGHSFSTNLSLGVCKLHQMLDPDSPLTGENIDDTTQREGRCTGDEAVSGNGYYSGSPDTTDDCWSAPCLEGDFDVYMEGPEANQDWIEENDPSDFRTETNHVNYCNHRGNPVREGYVVDVSTDRAGDSFERGGKSPDYEVCLNIGDTVEDKIDPGQPGDRRDVDTSKDENQDADDNRDFDGDGNTEEAGGEWWDLDSERANEYLRSYPGNDLIANSDSSNPNHIAYYWRRTQTPVHADYYPLDSSLSGQTWKYGLALEDDCGPLLDGCSDAGAVDGGSQAKNPLFYSFLGRSAP